MPRIHRAVGLCAALIITLTINLAGCGDGPRSETLDTGDFLLTANTGVEGFGDIMVAVRSSQPGHCYFSPSDNRSGMIGVAFNADGTLAELTQQNAAVTEYNPVARTATGGLISRYHKTPNTPQDLVYTDEHGQDTLLVKDINKVSGEMVVPTFDYEPGGDLTLFLYEDGKTVYLKQTERLEGENTSLPGVVATGAGFLDGRRTQVFVDDTGTAYRFDPATTTLIVEPDLAWLGFLKDLPEVTANTRNHPRAFSYTRDIAVIRLDDVILVHNRDGATFELTRNKNSGATPLSERATKREAMAAGPRGVTYGCRIEPLDDERILLVDMLVNKLIVVAPSPGK